MKIIIYTSLGLSKKEKSSSKNIQKGGLKQKVYSIQYTMAKENQKRLKAQNFYKKW